jgi:hypothetical protein
MPRKKKMPFEPYWVTDDEGNDHYIDMPFDKMIYRHHKQRKATHAQILICNDISKNPKDWNLSTQAKFVRSAELRGFQPNGDDSTLKRCYKRVLDLLNLFTIYK